MIFRHPCTVWANRAEGALRLWSIFRYDCFPNYVTGHSVSATQPIRWYYTRMLTHRDIYYKVFYSPTGTYKMWAGWVLTQQNTPSWLMSKKSAHPSLSLSILSAIRKSFQKISSEISRATEHLRQPKLQPKTQELDESVFLRPQMMSLSSIGKDQMIRHILASRSMFFCQGPELLFRYLRLEVGL